MLSIQMFTRTVTYQDETGQEMEGKDFVEVSIFIVSKLMMRAYTNISLCKSKHGTMVKAGGGGKVLECKENVQCGGNLDVSCPGTLISNLEASGNTEGLVRRCTGQLLDAPAGAGPGSC